MEAAEKEFARLKTYFYVDSNSDVCSPLVIAPKATKPFIRFCGDYVAINQHIVIGHYPIPHVQHEIDRIGKYKIFLDLDMANSFHQFLLAEKTSRLLSVQTIWGEVRPRFMPEGIGPASGQLQATVSEIFADFSEWAIVIFDNFLVCCHDYQDAYIKLEKIIDRCIERNVVLKMAKTWLGFDYANFFGYRVGYQKYELTQERKDEIAKMPFPNSTKAMQSFLGSALFFKSFMPNYSTLCAPLNDTIKKDFDWKNRSSWTADYVRIFDDFKAALQNAVALHYPDYSLEWTLRVDASTYGVAAALLMKKPIVDSADPTATVKHVMLPIAFISQKFSLQASKWSVIEQEAYACYFGVKKFAYYLHCKHFTLETDHNNLIWMEASAVPKIVRWRVLLQSFSFTLRHIPGRLMRIVDHNSRYHQDDVIADNINCLFLLTYNMSRDADLDDTESLSTIVFDPGGGEVEQEQASPIDDLTFTPTEALKQCHNSRIGHGGARKTWNLLNKHFPGHRIPFRVVSDFVSECPICQKDRLGMGDALVPLVRHLKRTGPYSTVGLDTLTITPPDIHGNQYLTVIVNHFTKLAAGYPSKDHDGKVAASALYQYFSTYGLVDQIVTDPGVEFRNELMQCLVAWFGVTHIFSLVDRHESNGVERTNKEILRHLKALVMDERVKSKWSDPTVLPAVFYILNSSVSSETGVIPFHAHFGNPKATYFKIPDALGDIEKTHEYVRLLQVNLRLLTDLSKQYQDELVKERTKNSSSETQNHYSAGDFVLFQLNPSDPLPNKLHPKYLGPFEVINQHKNDVECRNLIYGTVGTYHVERLKLFAGTREQAFKLAQIDTDQYVITQFLAYRGDPDTRTTMEFEVEFADGSHPWLPWSNDLFETIQYEEFCNANPPLMLLKYRLEAAKLVTKEINESPITSVESGDIVYVDLRSYGDHWYHTLNLDDPDHRTYVLQYRYLDWANAARTKIWVICDILEEEYKVQHLWVRRFGSVKAFDVDKMTLIDKRFILDHPQVLSDRTRERILEKCRDL